MFAFRSWSEQTTAAPPPEHSASGNQTDPLLVSIIRLVKNQKKGKRNQRDRPPKKHPAVFFHWDRGNLYYRKRSVCIPIIFNVEAANSQNEDRVSAARRGGANPQLFLESGWSEAAARFLGCRVQLMYKPLAESGGVDPLCNDRAPRRPYRERAAQRKATDTQKSPESTARDEPGAANGAARERWCGPRDVRAGGAVSSSQNRLLGNGKF